MFKHPMKVCMTYSQHMKFSLNLSYRFFKGSILNKDFPFEVDDPSGIFQALILYDKPSVEKNNTEVCVFTDRV